MLSKKVEFRPELGGVSEQEQEFFSALPASAAVFRLRGEDPSAEPYVGKSANLRRRMLRLLGEQAGITRRLSLRDRVRYIEYQSVGSDFEAQLWLYRAVRESFPKTYQDRLRLRPAPLIKFILDNPYPRVAVTTRIASLRGNNAYYGPFATRAAAEQFASDALDFFKLRRCTDDLAPDPSFPGCVYSEMKMCMAPCFRGCTDDEYAIEAERVKAFFSTSGQSLVQELTHARNEASEQLDFERAAVLHAKLEKLAAVRTQAAEIVHQVDRLDGVMVQPSHLPESVALFRVTGGKVCAPVQLSLAMRQTAGEIKTPTSMESRIAAALALASPPDVTSAQEWMEYLSLLKRWYYRTSKIGEIFFTDEKGDLPMRRVVRGVARVFKGEKPQADLSETAGEYWKWRAKEIGIQ